MRHVNAPTPIGWQLIWWILVAAVTVAACGSADPPRREGIHVVATTTILGDVARHIVGPDGVVDVLLPIGADPHDYLASARQVALIQQADLVISNGLGLEGGLQDVLDAAVADGANVLSVGEQLDPIPFAEAGDHGIEDHGGLDPHVWLDPLRMQDAAVLIADEMEAAAPGGPWAAGAADYRRRLAEAHDEIVALLAAVPSEQRKLVTNHDSLAYFARRYDFEVVGAVIPGGATLAEPSSAQLAELVETIKAENVPAIFAETTDVVDLAEAIAAEFVTPLRVVTLHTGSLGAPGGKADSLIDMLVDNARLIAQALQ